MSRTHQAKLEQVAGWYESTQGLNAYMIECLFHRLKSHIRGQVLEVGPADGHLTQFLLNHPKVTELTVVEATPQYVQKLRRRFATSPQLTIQQGRIEEIKINQKFDTVIASHVLEHVPETHTFLTSLKHHAKPGGQVIITVPNAHSMHRLLGVKMGLIPTPESLNEMDIKIGHFRVYNPTTFKKDLATAGLKVEKIGTSFIKFLSNAQTETKIPTADWPHYDQLTNDFPNHGADLYALCR